MTIPLNRLGGDSARVSSCPWDVVLWDFDGTLADTGPDVWVSLNYAAARFGSRFAEGFMADGNNLALSMDELAASAEPPIPHACVGDFDRDVTVHYRTMSPHALTELYPGIEGLLGDLRRAGARNVIVTNKPQVALERLLDLKGWRGLFDGWVSPDSAGGGGLTKAQMMRLATGEGFDSGACVMVGDSWGDVAGAREFGAASVAVTYGDGSVDRLLAQRPDFVAEDPGALRDILLRG